MNNFLKLQSLTRNVYSTIRFCSNEPAGIPYYGFTYYPRDKNFQDPPYNPSKLFLIRRIKSIKGASKREKRVLRELNIDGSKFLKNHISVVKNIPQVNTLLWEVKHLVEIKPIYWKGELPEDCLGTILRSTGELVISPKLAVSEEIKKNSLNHHDAKIGRKYMQQYLLSEWVKGNYKNES
ncbi:mitochondrial 50S ribosomal protein L30, putative [Pediculus humanus corporis]|uniref:Mitochondrial 50S ribosomal protein L30, putative n=1 Tax=Pediculus humanus subsp. corporis TaxID=121224 RepID=E0VHG9_PEDHC|nr:mitochondrial 50S ribosomal protein L30, putative [Pediculus humanus corporis]EEB12825.1 mitochondrial 50S ribosomal protein L30, putative [Pediculus humanus corporis]